MTVLVHIHYTSIAATKTYQKAEIPLRGKSKELAAYEFWKWIKNNNQIDIMLEKSYCGRR